MKFKGSVDIQQARAKVVDIFLDQSKLKEWQEGFVKKELLQGEEGTQGAVSMIYFKHGKQEMELKETILDNQLPDFFEAKYEHKHMDNTLKSTFISLSDTETRYETEGEYTAFRGFIPKMMAFLFPGMFRKQAQKWLDNFKQLVEQE